MFRWIWASRRIARQSRLVGKKKFIVQANIGDTLWAGVLASLFIGKKRMALVYRHGNISSYWLSGSRVRRCIYRWLFEQCDVIATLSPETHTDLKEIFPGLRVEVCEIPNGVPFPKGHGAVRPSLCREVILHVGAFVPEKNHAGLLRVFSNVLRARPEAELWLVGEGTEMLAAQQLADELKIAPKVFFLGRRDDVPELMSQAKVFLLPSFVEGQPAVVIEAMLMSLPVVAYDVGSLRSMLGDDRGVLVPARDEHRAAQEVVKLLGANSAEWNSMCSNAKVYAEDRYAMSVVADKFAELYERLAVAR
ncbi:glycosyltransferase [Algiphilus sp. NNCM1]|nr:glycosyltransferase [Algiphilus sp.]MBY8965050.1 glycosyltransferase [Algiphilus acroporae]MCI5104203.1 glycosyltransferase [Algiphilus sp.]